MEGLLELCNIEQKTLQKTQFSHSDRSMSLHLLLPDKCQNQRSVQNSNIYPSQSDIEKLKS